MSDPQGGTDPQAVQVPRDYEPCADLFPAYHGPTAEIAAREKFKVAAA